MGMRAEDSMRWLGDEVIESPDRSRAREVMAALEAIDREAELFSSPAWEAFVAPIRTEANDLIRQLVDYRFSDLAAVNDFKGRINGLRRTIDRPELLAQERAVLVEELRSLSEHESEERK
jgi:hypothetical protein